MDSEWKTLGNTVPFHGLYVFWSQSWAMDPRGSSPAESQNGVLILTLILTPNPPIFLLDLSGNLMPGQLGQGLAGTQLSLVLCWFMAFKGPASVSLEMWPLCGISVPIPSPSGLMPHFLFLYAVTFRTLGDGD